MLFPKFHCEFNPAEHCWAISKYYCREHCSGNITTLEGTIRKSFQEISREKYLQIYQHAMEEIISAKEPNVKKKLKIFKSHRRPSPHIPWDHILREEEARKDKAFVNEMFL